MAIKLVVVVGFVGELDVPGKSMWGFVWFPCSAVGVKFVAFVAIVGKLIVFVELIGLNKSVCEFT